VGKAAIVDNEHDKTTDNRNDDCDDSDFSYDDDVDDAVSAAIIVLHCCSYCIMVMVMMVTLTLLSPLPLPIPPLLLLLLPPLQPVMNFDLGEAVGDIAWAPYSSTVFAAVTGVTASNHTPHERSLRRPWRAVVT